MKTVRTVLGEITPEGLGPVNGHEHVFQVSPLLPGDELDDPERSSAEVELLRGSGFAAMIDATPIGLGRRATDLRRISESTSVQSVASTGVHRDAHYAADHPLQALGIEARAELMLRDLIDGMPVRDEDLFAAGSPRPARTGVRAGMLKVGIEYWAITASERMTIEAIARVHEATNAPVMVHLEFCTAGHEVLDLLAELGGAESSVLLAHADRSPDAGLHCELMGRGAFLGYDGMARSKVRSDEVLLDLTERVLGDGFDRLLLGGDVARSGRFVSYGGMPGMAYVSDRYLPRLQERIGDRALDRILVDAPWELLGRRWRRGDAAATVTVRRAGSELGAPHHLRDRVRSFVEHLLDVLVVDVLRVVPVRPGVGEFLDGLPVDHGDRGLHGQSTDGDRVLGDRAEHHSLTDGLLLGRPGVETDHLEIVPRQPELLHGVDDADRGPLIGAVEANEVVRPDHRFRNVRGLQMVTIAVLDVDDLDV